jgi:hypothetical protein
VGFVSMGPPIRAKSIISDLSGMIRTVYTNIVPLYTWYIQRYIPLKGHVHEKVCEIIALTTGTVCT